MRAFCFLLFLLPLFISYFRSETSVTQNCPSEYDSLAKMNIYTFVDTAPSYPGGSSELIKFIARNFRYPNQDVYQGSFQIQFIVTKQGNILAARIKGKNYNELTPAENELLKVLYKMPKWSVGMCAGNVVAVRVSTRLFL